MQRDTFFLISGAWHGSWCWHKLIPRLEQAGYSALAPDLPGRGAVTLKMWTDSVCQILEAQPEPVILVGHSRGGIIISQVAERLPDKIQKLIYVSGFLLRQGESVLRSLRDDGSSALLRHVTLSEDKSCWTIPEPALREMFYGECAEEDVELARFRLTPEPAAPLMTPVRVTEQNFGRVPREYIECLRDKAVPPALQKRMYTALPCGRVVSLDTDHSPFFSMPDALAAHLCRLG